MAKALKIAAGVVAIAGLAIVTGGLAAGASLSFIMGASFGVGGLTVGGLFTAAALLNTGASLLSPKPKVPETSPSNTDRLTVSINTRAPRVTVVGSTAMATDLRDQEWSADQAYLHRFIVNASHKIAGHRQIWFDDKLAWTSTGGVQAPFVGFLNVTTVAEGSAAYAINIGNRMGSARRYTGLAYVYLRYKLTKNGNTDSPFASSIPSRLTIVGDGASFYDPRLDSTVPGGSGPMRADDQNTWAWNPSACRNPALAMLFYLLGWRIKNPVTGAWKLAVGKGIPAARVDLASFITAANLCDETVATAAGGTEPRYRCDGVWSEADDPSQVLENLKATMNAVLDDVDGKIRVTVLHNDLGAPIGSLSADDVQGAFTWNQTPALSDCVNVLRGGYTDASDTSLYQLVDFPEARIDSPDGIDRAQTLNLPLVQSASQAQRLVKTRLQRAQYPGAFQATFLSTAWRFQKGDVIRFSFFPLGWVDKLFRIADTATQVDGLVPMLLREEHPSIYAFDGTEVGAVQGAEPTSYDPALWPIVRTLAEVGNQVSAIVSDGILGRGSEKLSAGIDYQGLLDRYNSLEQKYQALGAPATIASARDAARQAMADLTSYLGALQPAWDDRTVDTPIDPSAYEQRWTSAIAALEAFGAAITGQPGRDGTDGLPGAPGADGRTSYVHYAYANAPDGSIDFTTGAPGLRTFEGSYTDFTASDSTDAVAYVWREYRGPPFGLAARGAAIIAGSSVIKNPNNVVDWNSDAYSTVGFANGAVASCRFSGGRAMMGLNTDPTADASYSSLDFAWFYVADAGLAQIYENGQNIGTQFSGLSEAYQFRVEYDGRYVKYYVDSNGPYRTVDVGPGKLFYFDSSLYDPGARLNDVQFLARGANGADGRDGINGTNGAPGRDGVNGGSAYFHVAYANSIDGSVGFTTGDANGRYFVGILVDNNPVDSEDYHLYSWSQLRGQDGLNGSNGVPGPAGPDGRPTYVHFAYANSANGQTDFSTSDPSNRKYIGVYSDYTLADSNDPAAYTWSLVKGADGSPGAPGANGTNGTNGADGPPGPPGRDGVSADQAGMGLLTDGSGNVSIPSSGNTIFTVANAGITVQAGRKFRLTLAGRNPFYNNGDNIAVAQIDAIVTFAGGQTAVLFSGTASVNYDGSLDDSQLITASTFPVANPGSGSATLTIRYQRVGPIGNSASFNLAWTLERI